MKEKKIILTRDSHYMNELMNLKLSSRGATLDMTPEIQKNNLYLDFQDATHLTVSNFEDWDSVIAIAKFASTSKTLHTIEFDHIVNECTIDNITDLVMSLSEASSIHSFKMSNCSFSGSTGEDLAFCLSKWMPNLHYVDLSNNNIGTFISTVVENLMNLPYILKIDVSKNFPPEINISDLAQKRHENKIHDMVEACNTSAREFNKPFFEKVEPFLLYDYLVSDAKDMVMKQVVGKAVGQDVQHTIDITYE
jgi:hypothetical protein